MLSLKMEWTNNFNKLVQKAILKTEKRKHSFHKTHYVRHPVNKVTLSKYWVENNNNNLYLYCHFIQDFIRPRMC